MADTREPLANDFWHVLAYEALDPDPASGHPMFGLRLNRGAVDIVERLFSWSNARNR